MIFNERLDIIFYPSYLLIFNYILEGMILKKEKNCDTMEKIWIKKELYFLSYDFLKFLIFFGFLLTLLSVFCNKNRKKWGIFLQDHGADMAYRGAQD